MSGSSTERKTICSNDSVLKREDKCLEVVLGKEESATLLHSWFGANCFKIGRYRSNQLCSAQSKKIQTSFSAKNLQTRQLAKSNQRT